VKKDLSKKAPFIYFGGKSSVTDLVWSRLGRPKQYLEPFCGSLAMLLASEPASLEVVGDANGFIANFWRCVRHQPQAVAQWADYPVSHVDLGARHVWLMSQRDRLGAELQDPDWPGDAKVAGWWLWGINAWIGSGWCDWWRTRPLKSTLGKVPHVSDAGRGIQALGKVPHVSDAGRGIQAIGKVPHVGGAGQGYLTSSGCVADAWLRALSSRLERVRVVHGTWDRSLNHHYGAENTAVFLDPPYKGYDEVYGCAGIASQVEHWARDNASLRIALCGHAGDYDLPGWEQVAWTRTICAYSSTKTKDAEMIWFSPACIKVES
jgi:DNA adenine methylase